MTPRPLRAISYFAYSYKRTWRGTLGTTILFPLLYLSAMGLGVGRLVSHHVHQVDHVSYLQFIAPGLLAATAMQLGANEAMYPVMAAVKWLKTYFAMLASPLGVDDVLIGHLIWISLRLAASSVVFLAVMAGFGTTHSWTALAAVPAAVLCGMAFAAPLAAFASLQQSDTPFVGIYRFGILPLFLFSGTFFPLNELPRWLQVVALLTPLEHGVSLCRTLVLGHGSTAGSLVDAVYLLALVGGGCAWARWAYHKRLAP